MDPARISPLCDKDLAGMSPKNLAIEIPGETQHLNAHLFDVRLWPLSEWLRGENRFEAKRGISPTHCIR